MLLPSGEAAAASPPAAGESTLFAFDDHSIPWQHNLKLTLIPATKHPGNPVLRRGPEGSPDWGHTILYGTVLHDGRRFRMWYLGMKDRRVERGQPPGWWRPMCYAESEDGMVWTKPELGLHEFNGSRRNNICRIEGEPWSLTRVNDFLTVLHEPGDPDPARRYKAAYIAHVPYEDVKGGTGNRQGRLAAFICAASADGLSWKVVGDRPVNAADGSFEVTGLYRFGDFYYAPGQVFSPYAWRADGSRCGRVMLTYRSPDFVHWSRARAFSFARPGQLIASPVPGQQTHMGAGLWNRGNVLVGLYGMWQDGPAQKPAGASHLWGTHIDLGLVVSNDGAHFREPVPDFKVIGRGGEGEWDSIALLQGHAFVNAGDRTMIWYSHWDTSAEFRTMEIGLARLRRDGFGCLSLQAAGSEGQFVTAALTSSGRPCEILMNAENVTEDGPLTVELLDHLDRPLAGFSGRDAARVAVAGTRQPVAWPRGRHPRLAAGKRFAVRVGFGAGSPARVYSLAVTA